AVVDGKCLNSGIRRCRVVPSRRISSDNRDDITSRVGTVASQSRICRNAKTNAGRTQGASQPSLGNAGRKSDGPCEAEDRLDNGRRRFRRPQVERNERRSYSHVEIRGTSRTGGVTQW